MSIKRSIGIFIWICGETLVKIFILVRGKKSVVKDLEVDFASKGVLVISPHADDETIGCFH